MFFSSRNWWKRTYWQRHYFWRKKTKSIRKKKLGGKFIRINTSNAKNGYHLDYEVSNVQAFIDEFKNKNIKKLEKKLIKEKELEEKLEKQMREKSEKELKEKLEDEVKDKNKELKKKIKKLTSNQIIDHFGKILMKNW